MNGSTTLWIVLGIIALIVVAAVIYFATRTQADARRREGSLRRQAHPQTNTVRHRGKSTVETPRSRPQVAKETDETRVDESQIADQTRVRRLDNKREPDPPA